MLDNSTWDPKQTIPVSLCFGLALVSEHFVGSYLDSDIHAGAESPMESQAWSLKHEVSVSSVGGQVLPGQVAVLSDGSRVQD